MDKYCVEDLNHLDDTSVNLFDSKDPAIKNENFIYSKTEDLYCKIEENDVLVSKNTDGVIESLSACNSTDGVANLKNEFIPEDCVPDETVVEKIEITEHPLELSTIQELEHICRDYDENVADEGTETSRIKDQKGKVQTNPLYTFLHKATSRVKKRKRNVSDELFVRLERIDISDKLLANMENSTSSTTSSARTNNENNLGTDQETPKGLKINKLPKHVGNGHELNIKNRTPKTGVEDMEQQEIDMEKDYKGHDCYKVLINRKSLKRHIKRCHEEVNTQTFQCYHCNKILSLRQSLIVHLQQLHMDGDKLLHCDSCTYKTNVRQSLADHVYRLHVPNDQKPSFKCKLCPYETKYKGNLEGHINRVHLRKIKTKKCDQCDWVGNNSSFSRHVRTKHLGEEFICDKCNFKTKTKGNLITHQWIHSSEAKQFSCPICTYQTHYKSGLKVHLKYHKDNFQRCPECSQLVQEGNFYHHLRNHRRKKLKVQKKCPECGKDVFELSKHLLTHAGGRARIQCPECSYSAVHGSTVKKHIQKCHDHHKKQESFICYHCNKEIVSRRSLIKHLRTVHTNDSCECHICGKKLKSKLYLPTHVKRVHDIVKWFECDLCPEETRYRTKHAYSLKWHKVRHLNKDEVIMYKCEYCPYETKVPRYLQQHVYRCHFKKSKGLKTHSI